MNILQDRCSIFATFAKNDLVDSNILGYLRKKTVFEKLNQIKINTDLMNKLNEIGCVLPDKFQD